MQRLIFAESDFIADNFKIMTTYDIELFEKLNAEYLYLTRKKGAPLFPSAHDIIYDLHADSQEEKRSRKLRVQVLKDVLGRIDSETASVQQKLVVRGQIERGRLGSKLSGLLRDVDIAGKDVVEIGCGHGWVSDGIARYADANSVVGLDVRDYPWEKHDHPKVRLLKADLSQEEVLPSASADVVASFVVMEHVSRPLQMLRAIFNVLKPGGVAWLRFNLYRGWNASHRSDQVYFPWPHLLFTNDVCKEYFKKHHGRPLGFSWLNKLTLSEYLIASSEVGFDIEYVDLIRSPTDVEFYRRFEDQLGNYPILDLGTPFMKLILRRPASRSSGYIPNPGYVRAQQEFDIQLRKT